jgi:class 3 adenylate cyclase
MESIGELNLKGFHRPVKAFNVRGLREEFTPHAAGV